MEKEVEFRNREALSGENDAVRSQQVAYVKRDEARESRWSNPLVIAVIGATLAGGGNAVVSWINGRDQQAIETQRDSNAVALETVKAEAARILEVVKTTDPDKAAANLQFLLDAGLITDQTTASKLKKYLAERKPGQGVSLPAGQLGEMPTGEALSHLVLDECVTNWTSHLDPAPCAFVSLEGGISRGFSILKDRSGRSQVLVIPTMRVTGIEDPYLLTADSPNYWKAAWNARRFIEESLGKKLSPDEIGVAVNSSLSVSQAVLHMHVDCIREDVKTALEEHSSEISESWTSDKFLLNGHKYRAIRMRGLDIDEDPFKLLAGYVSGAQENMRFQTLVLTAVQNPNGDYDAVVLNSQADLAHGNMGGGEELLDHACSEIKK